MGERPRSRTALRIAGLYLLVSIAWILLSDRVVRWLGLDLDGITWAQSLKGLGFVVATSLVLFVVTRHYLGHAEAATRRVQEAYDQTLAGWAAALDIRDRSTAAHTHRVTELTVALAERFGFEGEELVVIGRGATLHDIGKMGVPDAVLAKPGPLDDEEWALMRRHPQLAVDMLAGIEYLRTALDIPRCHHEKWDGTGYPAGLAGEQIPLPARMFAVVDVFDAVTSERPYRHPMPVADAVALLESESGRHFDPAVVEAFLPLVQGRSEQVTSG